MTGIVLYEQPKFSVDPDCDYLNKKICSRCKREWNEDNEEQWKQNETILCFLSPRTPTDINFIPVWCQYKLEHVVQNRAEKGND